MRVPSSPSASLSSSLAGNLSSSLAGSLAGNLAGNCFGGLAAICFPVLLLAGACTATGGNYKGNGALSTFSCDVTAGIHSCNDYTWSGVYSTAAWEQSCTAAGGSAGTGCSQSDAVGGCKISASSGGATVTTTTWYYTGSESTVMTACDSASGTFVAPGMGGGGNPDGGGQPMGSFYRYVVNRFALPMNNREYAIDLNGDTKIDNQFGNLFGTLATQNIDFQLAEDSAVSSGSLVELVKLQTTDSGLKDDGSAGVTLQQGAQSSSPDFSGNGNFSVDASGTASLFKGALAAGKFTSPSPASGGTSVSMQLPIVLSFLTEQPLPLVLPLQGAHVSFSTGTDPESGAPGLLTGQIHGCVLKSDLDSQVVPALAAQFTRQVQSDPSSSSSKQLLSIFDTGGCGIARAMDGVIETCEVLGNSIIQAVLAPDVQIDENGHYVKNASQRNALSLGVGFTAVKANF